MDLRVGLQEELDRFDEWLSEDPGRRPALSVEDIEKLEERRALGV